MVSRTERAFVFQTLSGTDIVEAINFVPNFVELWNQCQSVYNEWLDCGDDLLGWVIQIVSDKVLSRFLANFQFHGHISKTRIFPRVYQISKCSHFKALSVGTSLKISAIKKWTVFE